MSQRNGPLPVGEHLLKPSEAASRLGVATATLVRWAKGDSLDYRLTLTGKRLYVEESVDALLDLMSAEAAS